MPQLIQPITDALRRGDKAKAIELIKQALAVDPKDIDVLLVLATIVDEPARKRQVLNRILSMAPTHKAARDMLLELDRAEMSAYHPQPTPASASPDISAAFHQPSTRDLASSSGVTASPTPQDSQAAAPSTSAPPSKRQPEKPLVFRPSTIWLIFLYLFTTIFCCGGALLASQDVSSSVPLFGVALIFGLTALSLSSKVEVKESGIRSSNLLSSREIRWNDIAGVRSNSMSKKLELVSNKGDSVKISTQVKGYPAVIEILRQKRPDLFGQDKPSSAQGYDRLQPTTRLDSPAFTGTKTFKKSFFKQYGLLFVLVPMCLFFVWLSFADIDTNTRTAFWVVAAFCALLMLIPFFQVTGLKVEPNKLTIQTFFEEKELSAGQIKEIKMQSVHGRYGRVTNFVHIIAVEGKKYPLNGFPEGEEILYGFLMNWWDRYQNR